MFPSDFAWRTYNRYGRVAYFFEIAGTRKDPTERYKLHIEWFNRATHPDALGPIGCEKELFALDLCQDISVSSIAGSPLTLSQPNYPLLDEPPSMFCTYFFSGASFIHLSKCPGRDISGTCFVCALHEQKKQEQQTDKPSANATMRRIRGVLYHLHDFVFLRRRQAKNDYNPLDAGVSPIAQIKHFAKDGRIHVTVYQRTGASSSDPFGEVNVLGDNYNIAADQWRPFSASYTVMP